MNEVVSNNLRDALAKVDRLASLEPQMLAASDAISASLLAGNKLLACGNGGSAADASHLTTEFVCRFNRDRRPYPAMSLAVHGGDLTAIGNDYDLKDVFARQIEAFGKPGDLLTVFSTSGRSEDVRRALVSAASLGLTTRSFLGRGGGTCAGLVQIELIVASEVTARIQEGHKFLLHTICELVVIRLATET